MVDIFQFLDVHHVSALGEEGTTQSIGKIHLCTSLVAHSERIFLEL